MKEVFRSLERSIHPQHARTCNGECSCGSVEDCHSSLEEETKTPDYGLFGQQHTHAGSNGGMIADEFRKNTTGSLVINGLEMGKIVWIVHGFCMHPYSDDMNTGTDIHVCCSTSTQLFARIRDYLCIARDSGTLEGDQTVPKLTWSNFRDVIVETMLFMKRKLKESEFVYPEWNTLSAMSILQVSTRARQDGSFEGIRRIFEYEVEEMSPSKLFKDMDKITSVRTDTCDLVSFI